MHLIRDQYCSGPVRPNDACGVGGAFVISTPALRTQRHEHMPGSRETLSPLRRHISAFPLCSKSV